MTIEALRPEHKFLFFEWGRRIPTVLGAMAIPLDSYDLHRPLNGEYASIWPPDVVLVGSVNGGKVIRLEGKQINEHPRLKGKLRWRESSA